MAKNPNLTSGKTVVEILAAKKGVVSTCKFYSGGRVANVQYNGVNMTGDSKGLEDAVKASVTVKVSLAGSKAHADKTKAIKVDAEEVVHMVAETALAYAIDDAIFKS